MYMLIYKGPTDQSAAKLNYLMKQRPTQQMIK